MSSTKSIVRAGLPNAQAEALIREARRRQRRRYAVGCGLVIAVAAVVAAALSGGGSSRPLAGRTPARSHPRTVLAARPPAQIPESVNTTLVMWPVQGNQYGGVYVDNLRTRHFWQPLAPPMDPGEFQPVLPVGRWIVWSDGSVHAVSAVNPGNPKLLGKTWAFAPSVTPGHVWLEYHPLGRGQNYVRLVAVPGGQAGPPIDLPREYEVIAGTSAGLLVDVNFRRLAIWNPGAASVVLPFSASASVSAAAVGQRTVAYETGCRDVSTAQNLPAYGGMGYPVCQNLRVYDVVTGRLRTFARPAGTIGWTPNRVGDFWSFTGIAPSGRLMAARAALAPAGRGVTRVYVLRLTGSNATPRPVPSSAALLLSATAWSRAGSWLFYQGPTGHLWAYRPATGQERSSKTPCCDYEVLAPLHS